LWHPTLSNGGDHNNTGRLEKFFQAACLCRSQGVFSSATSVRVLNTAILAVDGKPVYPGRDWKIS
jgi:hypothetical protein